MKITIIKQQIKNPERASFFIDGKYSFSLSLNELVVQKLRINQEIDEADLTRLKKLSEDGKLKNRTLEWVVNRPRSIRELKNYLYQKKAEPDQAIGIVEDFEAKGYISDEKFALWLIDMRRRRGKSDRAIQSELMKKGVPREVITEKLQKDSDQERQLLKELIDKKRRLSRFKNDDQILKQYLLRKGFNYEDINFVLLNAE